MKRTFLFVFITVLLIIFSGCGGQNQPAQPTGKAETAKPATSATPVAQPPAVGEMVYVAYMQVPNSSMELAKVTAVSGQDVTIAWDDTWTKKGHEIETRKLSEIYRFVPLTKQDAIVGCDVIIEPPHTSKWVNFPGKITAVKGDSYTVSYNSGGTPKTDDVTLDNLKKLVK
jgi:hypothetical protein